SQVKQKTFIDVNEEGTEASAATSVEMETTSASIDEPFHMEVNRPFFITIVDEETEAILFMGSINNL
ncbi:MAG TPA: serpin family protein, partial [Virgibacillus sp.]